jgi:hypothetical protein
MHDSPPSSGSNSSTGGGGAVGGSNVGMHTANGATGVPLPASFSSEVATSPLPSLFLQDSFTCIPVRPDHKLHLYRDCQHIRDHRASQRTICTDCTNRVFKKLT